MPLAVRSSVRPAAFANSALPSASMRTLPADFWSRAHAPITTASFTLRHQISSTPAFLSSSNFSTKPGTCLAEQVGVNAPGRAKRAIVLPFAASAVLTGFGPMEQPLPSTSEYSCRVAAGSVSPTLIIVGLQKKKRPTLWAVFLSRAAVRGSDLGGLLDQARGDPRLRLGDGTRFLDLDDVAEVEFALLVVRVVLARLADDLAVERVLDAALDEHGDGLGALVAHDLAHEGALQGSFFSHVCSSFPYLAACF